MPPCHESGHTTEPHRERLITEDAMRVAEIMSTRVRTIGPADSAVLAWERMHVHRIHHLVVARDGRIVGIVTDRDLGGVHGGEVRDGRSVRDLMTPSVITIPSNGTVREAANLMRGHRAGSLPVVDNGKLVGIVTVWDFLDLIGRGADRPVAHAERWTLRNRGRVPHGPRRASLTNRTKGHVIR
jgi:acetoin utilization protein AcuB